MKRHFLTLNDLTKAEIESLLDRAARLKSGRASGLGRGRLTGRTVGMIFNKPSTRTRVSFQVGVYELGGQIIYMQNSEIQAARGEPLAHTAQVLSRYLDALVVRTFEQSELEELARYATIPIINALTDQGHPCQVLSDLLTLKEKLGRLDDLKVAWVGDGNNVAHSWIEAAAIIGFDLRLAVPKKYPPDPEIIEWALARAKGSIEVTNDPQAAVAGANAVNTDVWASMGQESQAKSRIRAFKPYQVNAALMALADPQAIFLHCLPAHLGQEVSPEVFDGPRSVVFDQAENRLHAQKALLEFLILGDVG